MAYASHTGTFSTVINWEPPDTALYDNFDVSRCKPADRAVRDSSTNELNRHVDDDFARRC
jgi:hypothetical protein